MLELGARSAPSPPLLRTCAAQRVAGHTHQAQMRNGSKASSPAATHPGRLRRLVRRSGCLVNNRLDSAMDCQDEDSIHDRVQPQRTRPRHVDDDVDGYQSNLYRSKSSLVQRGGQCLIPLLFSEVRSRYSSHQPSKCTPSLIPRSN